MGRSEKNTLKVFNKTSSQNTFLFPFGCTELTIICVLKGYETCNVSDATNKITHSSTLVTKRRKENYLKKLFTSLNLSFRKKKLYIAASLKTTKSH